MNNKFKRVVSPNFLRRSINLHGFMWIHAIPTVVSVLWNILMTGFTTVNFWLGGYVNVSLLFVCDVISWIVANILQSSTIRRCQLYKGKISNPA